MSILLLYKGRLGLIWRCHFYNVISLAARSRLCFMFTADFYWCVFSDFFFFCNAHHNYVSLFVILFLFKKDIQRVRAKIHIPEFLSAALHVEFWKRIRKGYAEREKVLKRNFDEQVAMNLFVVLFFKSCNDKQQLYVILSPFNWFISTLSSSFIFSGIVFLIILFDTMLRACLTNE